jgi:RNA polymerase sigma factor for flagellar operon FliA
MPRADRSGSAEDLFLSQLDVIDRVISFVSSRHHLPGVDADDFDSHVKMKLIEDDYGILRKFQGRCNLRTYLTVVVQRLFLDYRITAWGKWRPSAEAKRCGQAAILLERLTQRDGYGFEEACELMETNHQVTLSRAEIETIAARLPHRVRRRFESDAGLRDLPADQPSLDEIVVEQEHAVTAARVETALNAVMAGLDSQDRLIFQLRFRDGRTVADIARTLRLDQKALYRRVNHCLDRLLKSLQGSGIDKEQALKIFESAAVSVEWREPGEETLPASPSPKKGEGSGARRPAAS